MYKSMIAWWYEQAIEKGYIRRDNESPKEFIKRVIDQEMQSYDEP